MSQEDGPNAEDRIAPHSFWAILALSAGTMATSLDNGAVAFALPSIAPGLGVDASQAVLLVTVFQLILIMTVLPVAALGERFGHRVVYQCGQLCFCAGMAACVFAPNLTILLIARAIQGAGAAASFGTLAGLMRAVYPKTRLGSGLAINTAVAATSASLAPTLGGLVLAAFDWRWLFAFNLPIAILSLLLARSALPATPTRTDRIDIKGSVLCAAMFGAGALALESLGRNLSPLLSLLLVAATAITGVYFVRRELANPRPILPVDLWRQPAIVLGCVASVASTIASTCIVLTLPFRLQHSFGYSTAEAGFILAAWPIVMMIAAPTFGVLSDRVSASLLGGVSMIIASIGAVALGLLPHAPLAWDIIWRIGLTGVGFAMFVSPNARQIIAAAPLERAGAAGALTQTMRQAGLVLGASAVSMLLAFNIGAGPAAAWVAAALAALTGACSFAQLRKAQAAH